MADTAWTLTDRKSAAEAIKRLGEDDLLFLNRLIVERLKLLEQARATAEMSRFHVGQRVSFQGHYGETKHGAIQKLNKKTATVITQDGQRWNVAPALLSPITDLPEQRK